MSPGRRLLEAEQVVDPRSGRTVNDPGVVLAVGAYSQNIWWMMERLHLQKCSNPKLSKHAGPDGRLRVNERSIDLSQLPDERLDSLAGILASARESHALFEVSRVSPQRRESPAGALQAT